MKIVRRLVAFTLSIGLVAVVVAGGLALSSEVQAAPGGCLCPKIYAPVVCDHGKWYANPCLAACRNAKNCVPTGEI